jgi:hypothetical protein
MEILIFTLNGVVIYLLADWVIRLVEQKRGEVLKNRQIIFFVVFLSLALLSFNVIQQLF